MSDKSFCVTISAALALVAFVFVLRFLPDFVTWNGWDVCGKECNLRAWLDALSGWFGGIAAFATIAFVVLQLREQRLQTAFTIGDALPTMDAVEHLKLKRELVVRIVNWNRRGIVVKGISAGKAPVYLFPTRVEVDKVSDRPLVDMFDIRPFTLKGWEDRNKPPSYCEIRLEAWADDDLATKEDWSDVPMVYADVQIFGERHRRIRLIAETRLLTQGA